MSLNLKSEKNFEVLIVEDEIILAMSMETKLEKLGFNVSGIATTYDNAILHTNNHSIDLAIVDINLNSTKSGIDVANYMWKNFNIPIIFLTSYSNDKVLNNAMNAEPYAYLIKPCRDEELKVTINTTIHKHLFFYKNKNLIKETKNKFIYINKEIKLDTVNLELYINNIPFKLTKTEKKLFEILSKYPKRVVNFNTIFNFIYREDAYDLAKLRSLIYRLKKKLGFNPFENLYEEGYKLKTIDINENI